MPARFASLLDFDLDIARAGTSTGKLVHHFGFDPEARFQQVAVGQRKVLSTVGGDTKGLTATIKPTAICKFVTAPDLTSKFLSRLGIITIEGVAEGEAVLSLTDARGKEVDRVAIGVTKFRSVVTRFYNLVDDKGREGIRNVDTNPLFTPLAIEALVQTINDIVLCQCEVMMVNSGTGAVRNLTFASDLGTRVDINKVNPFSSTDLDKAAQYHVAFVWGIDGAHSNGITKSNFTLIQSSLPSEKRDLTIAHEFVHFLSGSGIVTVGDHDDRQSDLLFKTAPHGIMLRKARLQKIIH